MSLNNREVIYNGTNIQDISNLTITEVMSYNPPTKNLDRAVIANADKSAVSADFYVDKRIVIKGYIAEANKALLEERLSQLYELLDYREAILSVEQANKTLEYTATVETVELSDTAGGYSGFQIDFFCSDPFGYSPVSTTILDVASLTNNNQSYVVTTEGTTTQLPYVTLTIDSIAGGNTSLYLSNLTRGETMEIVRSWEVGDILIIDSENGTVTVNGTEVEYIGKIFTLNKGSNSISYDDDFTSRSIDLIIDYRKRWI